MGFLTGKTAIITGAGRAVLSDGRCGLITSLIQEHIPCKVTVINKTVPHKADYDEQSQQNWYESFPKIPHKNTPF